MVSGSGRRARCAAVERAGLPELIYSASNADQDPVLWNDQLYFVASTPTSSGEPLVLHCVD